MRCDRMKAQTKVIAIVSAIMIMALPMGLILTETQDKELELIQETDGAIPILVYVGVTAIVAFIGGYYFNEYWNDGESQNSGLTDPEGLIADYLRNEAQYRTGVWYRGINTTTQGMTIDQAVLNMSETYYSRAIEGQTAGMWTPGEEYESAIALRDAGVLDDMITLSYHWGYLMDLNGAHDKDLRATLQAQDKYRDMRVYFEIGDNQLGNTPTGQIYTISNPYVYATNPIRAYIGDTGDSSQQIMVANGTVRVAYDDDPTRPVTMSPGIYPADALKAGLCTVSGGGILSAPIIPVDDTPDTHYGGGYGIISGDTKALVARNPSSGEYTAYALNGATYTGPISYVITYPDQGVTQKIAVPLDTMVSSYDEFVQFQVSITRNVSDAGQVAWKLYDAMGSANPLVSPSSITPLNLDNTSLTADQKYAISVLGMYQISQWMKTNPDLPTLENIHITEESLNLFVIGDITNEKGEILASNVVYTPYGYVRDVALSTTEATQWSQAGMAIVWGNADTWEGQSQPENMRLITLEPNYTISADTITYDGEDIPRMVITVKSLQDIAQKLIVEPNPDPDPVPDVIDISALIAVIFALIGAIIAMVGVYIRSPLLVLIGLAFMGGGYYLRVPLANWIAGMLAV